MGWLCPCYSHRRKSLLELHKIFRIVTCILTLLYPKHTHAYKHTHKIICSGFPVGPVVKIYLSMQGTWVQSLVQEDHTCHGATKLMHHNYWTPSPRAPTTEIHTPIACAWQQEKPLQWEANTLKLKVAPAHCKKRKPACTVKTQYSQNK